MIVFDAEPLIAYYWDEPGSDRVDERFRAIESGDEKGLVNAVTCAEVHYVVREDDDELADRYLDRLGHWLRVVDAGDVWEAASLFKHRYRCALGDSFVLATALEHDCPAFVGADDCFDDVTEVEVERFRTEPV